MRPGLRMPCGSKVAFRRRWSSSSGRGSGLEDAAVLVAAAKKRRVAAGARGARAPLRRRRRPRIQRSAPPHSMSCRPGSAERRRGRWQRDAPQRRASRKKACVVLAHLVPERCRRLRSPRRRASARAARTAARRPTAARSSAPSRARRRRDRTAAGRPTRSSSSIACASSMLERAASAPHAGSGSTLSETSASSPSVPSEPTIEPRDVVARDVLHHLAAEARERGPCPSSMRTPSTKSRALPAIGAARSGQSGGDAAAERRASAEVRRLEREHLAVRSRSACSISASGVPRAR